MADENASCRNSENGILLLPHAQFSPDLAPSDFYIFPNIKQWLEGKRITHNEQVIDSVTGCFADLDKSTYETDITALDDRWTIH